MNTRLSLLLAAGMALSVLMHGGCGGVSQNQLKKYAQRKSAPEIEEPPSAKPPPAATPQPAATPKATSPALPPPPPVSVQAPPSVVAPKKQLTLAERRSTSISNLEKIGTALKTYAAKHGKFPPQAILDDDGNPMLSWRVAILPELGYQELYDQFRVSLPWFNVSNKTLLAQMPVEYQSPERQDTKTNYLGVGGEGMALGHAGGFKLSDLKDGLENTLAVIEVDDRLAQEWTQPIDFTPNAADPRDGIGSLRNDGAFGVLASGRVVLAPRALARTELSALFTAAGGERVELANLLPAPTAEPMPATAVAASASPKTEVADPSAKTAAVDKTLAVRSTAAVKLPTAVYPSMRGGKIESGKTPVPDSDLLAKSRTLLKELYKDDYEQAQTTENREKFAKKLLTDAPKVSENASDYYEVLRIARDVAVAVGDVQTTMNAVALINERFAGDELQVRLKALQELENHAKQVAAPESVRQEASRLLREAFQADRFDVAIPAHSVLLAFKRLEASKTKAATTARERELKSEVTRLASEREKLEEAKTMYSAVQAALVTLQGKPVDGEANETVGRYLCFVKNQWDEGLPFLAQASDIKLRVIATIDLTPGRTAAETLSLGDQYWELSGDHKEPQKRGLRLRAAYCYETARVGAAASLEKLKAEKRIAEAKADYGSESLSLSPKPPIASY